uniref:DapF n=1 Tax=Dichelobacter nodosus TaxID=870 RepID=Q5I744_DICNO|nr:DapF [Dichelobacter nodosus]
MNEHESSYATADHKMLLADCILEINELSKIVKELHNEFTLIQEDIDTLNRSLNDFYQQIHRVKIETSEHLSNVVIEAFDEQLKKVEEMLKNLTPTPKKKFRLF